MTQAAPGDLDFTFGTGGIVTTAIGTAEDKVNSLAIQSDGKLVAAGYSYNGVQNKFALVRYNTDGSLDMTFGAGGIVTTAVGTSDDRVNSLAIQSDGKLVVAGYSYNGSQTVFALVRYNTDGSLDTTFGTGGIVTTAIGTETIAADNAFALAIQPDGKLVAAGFSTTEGDRVFALARYDTNGSLDTGFGTEGIVTTHIGADPRAFSLAIQSDGKLVAGGVTLGNGNYDFALARYNSDGSLDTTFGTGGIVTTDFAANDDDAKTLAIQSDGKPVLAGHAYVVTQRKFPLARYNTNGTLDSSFGSGGIVTTAIGTSDDRVKSLAIQSDGKLVAAGLSYNGSQFEFALVRYNTDGSLDSSFGSDGIVTTAIGTSDDEVYALAIQSDGKLVVAGYTYTGTQYKFALVRYLGDDTTTTTTTTSTTTSTTTTTTTTTSTTTTTTLSNQPPSADSLTPVNIATVPSVVQSFTAAYSDPNGYENISDAGLFLSGVTHNEWVHYSPATNKFTLMGVSGDCSPGQAATISSGFLTLNCGSSSASGSGTMLTVTYNLTPQPPLSGAPYLLIISVTDQGGASNNKTTGSWIVNRPPSADSVSPMNSATAPGTVQIFTAVYSDPDGWQNIAAANFYLSGDGGTHNEWLHYLAAPNLFTMMGTNDVCNPGQAATISNGFLTLDCATSSISGSGTVLTVIFQVTPLMSSSGIQYNIFSAASDHAAAAHAILAGTWGIQSSTTTTTTTSTTTTTTTSTTTTTTP